MKEKIAEHFYEDEDLIEISVSCSSQFVWHSKREFEYNGVFYDVIRTMRDGLQIKMLCLKDDKETQVRKLESSSQSIFTSSLVKKLAFHHYSKNSWSKHQKKIDAYAPILSSKTLILFPLTIQYNNRTINNFKNCFKDLQLPPPKQNVSI